MAGCTRHLPDHAKWRESDRNFRNHGSLSYIPSCRCIALSLVAGVVGEVYCCGKTCGQDAHTPCHIAVGVVGDGLLVS